VIVTPERGGIFGLVTRSPSTLLQPNKNVQNNAKKTNKKRLRIDIL